MATIQQSLGHGSELGFLSFCQQALEADVLRIEPLGRDNSGNTFYYFSGVRLWKESSPVRQQSRKRGR